MLGFITIQRDESRELLVELWRIGDPALGPAQFNDSLLLGEDRREVTFRVGTDDPAADWPGMHPGPLQAWTGWESKTAVIVFMIFFPMLVNAVAGLNAADRMQLDLMRSYGAGYWQTMRALRLPAALPFIFNALKINSTLALIGGIVAEFFGSGMAGMGFRISTQVQIMNVDVVWATIAIAAVARLLPITLVAVRPMSRNTSIPMISSRPASGRPNIGSVAALDDAVATFNATKRRAGKTVIRVRP